MISQHHGLPVYSIIAQKTVTYKYNKNILFANFSFLIHFSGNQRDIFTLESSNYSVLLVCTFLTLRDQMITAPDFHFHNLKSESAESCRRDRTSCCFRSFLPDSGHEVLLQSHKIPLNLFITAWVLLTTVWNDIWIMVVLVSHMT